MDNKNNSFWSKIVGITGAAVAPKPVDKKAEEDKKRSFWSKLSSAAGGGLSGYANR